MKGIDASKDYYKVLNVRNSAPEAEIKKAFYQLAKKYHPDSTSSMSNAQKKDAETKFKAINEAYAVIGKKDTRSLYDDIRRANQQSQRAAD